MSESLLTMHNLQLLITGVSLGSFVWLWFHWLGYKAANKQLREDNALLVKDHSTQLQQEVNVSKARYDRLEKLQASFDKQASALQVVTNDTFAKSQRLWQHEVAVFDVVKRLGPILPDCTFTFDEDQQVLHDDLGRLVGGVKRLEKHFDADKTPMIRLDVYLPDHRGQQMVVKNTCQDKPNA